MYPFIKNCGIDLKSTWDADFDKSFITVPITDLGNILDVLGDNDNDGVENISNIIVTSCKDNYNLLSRLSANDIVYNYLTNCNNMSKIIYDKLISHMHNNECDITNYVYDDLTGRGKKIKKSKLFTKILKCIKDEYQTCGLGGITVGRFLYDLNSDSFGEESFTLSYFDELTC